MANKFCRYLGNQYRIDTNGIAPCCWYQGRVGIFDKEKFKSLNEKLINQNDWTPECGYCRYLEDKELKSPRTLSLENAEWFGLNSTEEADALTRLEIQTDINCNGACLICGTHSSTTWQKFESKFDKTIVIDDRRQGAVARFERAKEIFNFANLKHIGFVNGGEPLKTDTHLLYLRELDKIGHLKNIVLNYITNGSTKPCEETVEFWKKAKEIRINVSIDGTQEHFNYLRWPLVFDQVEENISYILNLNLPGLITGSHAVTPFSAFYYDRYKAWSDNFFKKFDTNMRCSWFFDNPFGAGGIINLNAIPRPLRFKIITKYGGDHLISRLVLASDFSSEKYSNFMNYITLQDERRGLNFREVFPEIESHFKVE